jgi:hypothetical protein
MEENLERPNYYAILPANVRYADINSSAKLLYAEITALCNKTGTCWASNSYFAELYSVSADTVSRWVKELIDGGFVTSDINKKAGNRRYIRVTDVPIGKNDDSYRQKAQLNNNKTNTNSIVELEKSLLSLVNEITGRAFRTLPARGVKKTLDAFTLEEIESALRALAADSWHRPKLKELSIDYFIRSTTIDRFLDKGQKLKPTPKEKAGKMVRDEIVAKGNIFPAEWPEGKEEWTFDLDESGEERTASYFRGIEINHKTQNEILRIEQERQELLDGPE